MRDEFAWQYLKGDTMKPNSKAYLLLGTSFLTGGVSGFFIAKKLLQEHYRELAQSEIDEVREFYLEKYETKPRYVKLAEQYDKPDDPRDLIARREDNHEQSVRLEDRDDESEIDISDDEDDLEDEEFDIYDEAQILDRDGEDLIGTDEGIPSEVDFADQAEDNDISDQSMDSEVDESEEGSPPKVISYDDYIAGSFDHVELYYYRLDDVICTGQDVVVAYPQDILGWDWKEAIKKNNTIFVRDELAEVDYEIHALAQSYNDAVSVRLETDKEKKVRRLAREKDALDAFQMENLNLEKESEYEEVKPRKPKTKPYERPQHPRYDQMFEVNDEE